MEMYVHSNWRWAVQSVPLRFVMEKSPWVARSGSRSIDGIGRGIH